ncbi:MAG: ATP-binding cassette domain-containing protein [Albidovulum sp.]|nr:ATP-binding cassette domain-containing protein [Albidovulum sp.]
MASILLRASLLLAVLLPIPVLFGEFTAYQIGLYLIYGIAAQGIGFLWGKTGVLPLGQAIFFGISAYAGAMSLRFADGLALQLAAAAAIILLLSSAAFVVAFLIFRGRSESGPFFSLITLALAMIAEQTAGTATEFTGGFNGFSGFASIGGLDPFGNLYYVIAAAAVGMSLLLFAINRSPANLIVRAVADNEPRLQLLGYPTHAVKSLAFAFSAASAALAGILFASHQGIVTPTSTGFALSAELVILTAIGGRFHVLGPLIGAVVVGWASAELRFNFPYWELIMAAAFIIVVLRAPGGIAELLDNSFMRFAPNSPRDESARKDAPMPQGRRVAGSLEFDNVHLQAGVVRILNGISFKTPDTGIISVIGPNGAGKTSALNAITGHLRLTSGRIRFVGDRIDSLPPWQALNCGIGRKLQVPSVFKSMSVMENIAVSMLAGRASWTDYFRTRAFAWRSEELSRVLNRRGVPLKNSMEKQVGTLPQGHRQFLEFAMAIASGPSLLLLDEPCAGLSPEETALMSSLIREFQENSGGLVIVIEHDMSIVEATSDKVLVLHQGEVLAFDSYEAVRNDPNVMAVYAGSTK